MMERQIVVIGTSDKEAVDMLRSVRAAGVFCTMANGSNEEIPEEARGVIVIGQEVGEAEAVLRKVSERGLPVLAFGAPAAVLCEVLGGTRRGCAFEEEQLKDVRFANMGVCAGDRRRYAHAAGGGISDAAAGTAYAERGRRRDHGL